MRAGRSRRAPDDQDPATTDGQGPATPGGQDPVTTDGRGPAEAPAGDGARDTTEGGPGTGPGEAGVPGSRRAAAVATVALLVLLAVVIVVTTPWHPLPGPRSAPDPALDFGPAQIARSRGFNAALNPPAYAGLVVGLLTVLLLGLTPLGARLLGSVTRPLRRSGRCAWPAPRWCWPW